MGLGWECLRKQSVGLRQRGARKKAHLLTAGGASPGLWVRQRAEVGVWRPTELS